MHSSTAKQIKLNRCHIFRQVVSALSAESPTTGEVRLPSADMTDMLTWPTASNLISKLRTCWILIY